jgi:uncharacterized protein YbjT (DUF2867 family)
LERVLVVGATGNAGSQVVRQLLERGAHGTALLRRPEAAGLPDAVTRLQGGLTGPLCLEGVPGVDAAFPTWCVPLATAPAVVEALARWAGRIVFLSNMTVRDDVDAYDDRESTRQHTVERLISRGCQGGMGRNMAGPDHRHAAGG